MGGLLSVGLWCLLSFRQFGESVTRSIEGIASLSPKGDEVKRQLEAVRDGLLRVTRASEVENGLRGEMQVFVSPSDTCGHLIYRRM